MTYRTFMDQLVAGELEADAIDDFVDAWHASKFLKSITESPQFELPLREYLGLTLEEYKQWFFSGNEVLYDIAAARIDQQSKDTLDDYYP